MDVELPSEFDLIVVGTGVVESIVAAAASRIGKRVLHIDSNNYYGGAWASFNLDGISKLDEKCDEKSETDKFEDLEENQKAFFLGNDTYNIKVQSQNWHILEEKVETSEEVEDVDAVKEIEEEKWTREKLLKLSRKFNIDLTPKLHFARGDFVELLISSNIARYSEFRSVSRVITWLAEKLEIVPCSRSDVFSSTKVSVIEKRMLMKLLTSCLDGKEDEFKGYENKTFRTYLKDRKLTDNLMHYVLYSISMSNDDTLCMDGIEKVKRFLNSLGRFGKTPFLYSMYGSGEISQAFCRLCAVFGGVYALNQNISGFVCDQDDNFQYLSCGNQKIRADHLVLNTQDVPSKFLSASPQEFISRAIFIIDSSIMESDNEHLTLLLFPPEGDKNACTIIELGSHTGTCPKNLYIVHMITHQKINPEADFEHCRTKLFNIDETQPKRPKILWSFFFTISLTSHLKTQISKNIFLAPGPELDLDYDPAIKKAESIFKEIYPDVEFLPRAPDPEEIIIDGEDNNNEGDGQAEQQNEEASTSENVHAGQGDEE